jgi:hypothetical protein
MEVAAAVLHIAGALPVLVAMVVVEVEIQLHLVRVLV